MSNGNTTTVTHPDGTVSKRTSKTRAYTHAVEVMVPNSTSIAELERTLHGHLLGVEKYRETEPTIAARCQEYADSTQAKIDSLDPAGRVYFVLQWSASLKSASAAARKPFWNQDGKTSRVVEVDK